MSGVSTLSPGPRLSASKAPECDDITPPEALPARNCGNFMGWFERQSRTYGCTRTLSGFIPDDAEVTWGDE
jgi:hypothetical protein